METSPKGKDRPLAARRNLVKKASAEEAGDMNETKVVATESVDDSTGSNDSKGEVCATPAVAAATVAAQIKITSQRTRDIEKEIQINNEKHDKAAEAAPTDTKASKLVTKTKVINFNTL